MYGRSYEPPMRIGLRTFVGDDGNYGIFRDIPGGRAGSDAYYAKFRGLARTRLLKLYMKREKFRLFRQAEKRPLRRSKLKTRIIRLNKRLKRMEARTIRRAQRKFVRGRMPRPTHYRRLMAIVRLSVSAKRRRAAHNLLKKMSGRS